MSSNPLISRVLKIGLMGLGLWFGAAAIAQAQQRLTIATASAGGVFFPLGTGMADVLGKEIPGASFTAESTGGSAENVRLVGSGNSSMGLAMADVAYYARNGAEQFASEGAYEGLRGLMMIYTQMMHLVVPADSDIKTVADLAGRRISPGPAGSGTAFMAEILLDAYGIKDRVTLDRLTHDQQATALGDRRIEAAFFLFPPGGASVREYATAHKARFIPFNEPDIIAKIQKQYPFYAPAPIPAGTYPGQTEAVPSIGVSVVLVAHKDINDDVAYQITKVLNEKSELLVPYHSIASSIRTETALNGMPIELHPGAERYYREINHPGFKR